MTDYGGATNKPRTTSEKPTREGPYHHGDLHNALVRAAAELAETGGPDAVTVRGAARRVGVTPTAAYRHFTNHEQLLAAAQEQAQASLLVAMNAAIEELGPGAHAIRKLSALGTGYISFALQEPGLFRTAFCVTESHEPEPGYTGAPAFHLLSEVMDELVSSGYTDPAHRPDAELGAWSTVHGTASLLIEQAFGPLDDTARDLVIERAVALVRRGLATGPETGEFGPDAP